MFFFLFLHLLHLCVILLVRSSYLFSVCAYFLIFSLFSSPFSCSPLFTFSFHLFSSIFYLLPFVSVFPLPLFSFSSFFRLPFSSSFVFFYHLPFFLLFPFFIPAFVSSLSLARFASCIIHYSEEHKGNDYLLL